MGERIAVIGAGQMGNGIAHVFAQAGHEVTMIDVSADAIAKGRATIAGNLDRQVKKGTVTAEDKAAILGRIRDGSSLDAVKGASLVIEAAQSPLSGTTKTRIPYRVHTLPADTEIADL